MAKVLLKNGARALAKNKRNKTVYDMAAAIIDEVVNYCIPKFIVVIDLF